MQSKVTVIIGIYNCASTLEEAIKSILSQTYTEWSLVICDDGSMDNTYDIAQNYQQQYSDRIILLRNKTNQGLSYTLNNCLKYARGDYIARMDGDDISLPNRFEKEVNFLNMHPEYAIVSTPMIYFDENGVFRRGRGSGEPPYCQLARGTPFCHAPCMVRREAYEAVGGYSESGKRRRVEDWDLWVRMYARGYKGFSLAEPLYKMRDDRKACSRRKFKYRVNEARVCASAVKKLNLPQKNYLWVFRPILVGLLPGPVYRILHKQSLGLFRKESSGNI